MYVVHEPLKPVIIYCLPFSWKQKAGPKTIEMMGREHRNISSFNEYLIGGISDLCQIKLIKAFMEFFSCFRFGFCDVVKEVVRDRSQIILKIQV